MSDPTLRPDQMGHRIQEATVVGDGVLLAAFTDGQKRLWDLRERGGPGAAFDPMLSDESLFRQVRVDDDGEALTWPGGADVDADWLYHSGRPIFTVSLSYDRNDDVLFASFHGVESVPEEEEVFDDLIFMYDTAIQEWVGFVCANFSRHANDRSWLAAIEGPGPFFPLADPNKDLTLKDVLVEAAEAFLTEQKPAPAVARVAPPVAAY